MDPILLELFLRVNKEGGKGRQLIDVIKNPYFTVMSNPNQEYIFIYNDDPKNLGDHNPWPY